VFDTIGRMTQRWTGTNDYTFTDGEASPTDNMVKVDETEYDSSGSPSSNKNSLVTKRTQFIQDSTTGRRDTSFY